MDKIIFDILSSKHGSIENYNITTFGKYSAFDLKSIPEYLIGSLKGIKNMGANNAENCLLSLTDYFEIPRSDVIIQYKRLD